MSAHRERNASQLRRAEWCPDVKLKHLADPVRLCHDDAEVTGELQRVASSELRADNRGVRRTPRLSAGIDDAAALRKGGGVEG